MGGGGALPLEAVPAAREKKTRGESVSISGVGAESADRDKGISESRKTGKWYSNWYDQSLAVRLYGERVGKLRQHVH